MSLSSLEKNTSIVEAPGHQLKFSARTIFMKLVMSPFLHFLKNVSLDTEMLTGKAAMERCMNDYLQTGENVNCSVHLKITSEGVTVTDSQRLKFFRKHFPAESVSFCDFDPQSRLQAKRKVFGLVAKKPNNNSCILFSEKDSEKAPAEAIIESINKASRKQYYCIF